jgi:hypothetical protein
MIREIEWLMDYKVLNSDPIRKPATGTQTIPEFESSNELIEYKKGQRIHVEVMGDGHYRDMTNNINFTTGYGAKFRLLPIRMTKEEDKFLALLAEHVDENNSVDYATLRDARVPELVAEIFNSGAAVLDSLVNRKLQILRDKGWVRMSQGVYTILERPESWSKKASS